MVFAVVLTWQSESVNDVPQSQGAICNQSIRLQQISQHSIIIYKTLCLKWSHNGGNGTKMSILLVKGEFDFIYVYINIGCKFLKGLIIFAVYLNLSTNSNLLLGIKTDYFRE